MSKHDIEGLLILVGYAAVLLAIGALTSIFGNWLWEVFARIGASSVAVEWIAHATALGISCGVVYAVLTRWIKGRWPMWRSMTHDSHDYAKKAADDFWGIGNED